LIFQTKVLIIPTVVIAVNRLLLLNFAALVYIRHIAGEKRTKKNQKRTNKNFDLCFEMALICRR